VRFVTLADERADIVLVTRADNANPTVALLRSAALEALRTGVATFEPAETPRTPTG
jgi:hypothetical protein